MSDKINKFYGLYETRSMGGIIHDMKACVRTLNFCSLSSLIEEASSSYDRLEGKIDLLEDIGDAQEHASKLKKEIDRLENEYNKLLKKMSEMGGEWADK